ncbi:MAG: hypothetical protein GXZ19_00510 [Bacteroidales bacterium]|nr:hypothetical protein [Bacteroidales bacterium]
MKLEKYKLFVANATALILIILGMSGIYFFIIRSYKPELLQLKTFTLYSKYLETKTFTFIVNNQGDEIAIATYGIGWLLLVLSRNQCKLTKPVIAILLFIIGYFLFHGIAAVVFVFAFVLLLPLFLLIK